ncbi:MAG: T9SS type A sorting domain-containing protein [Bacteroidetes bacterium]|nr:T9SS type A sorting domain-containing protein [Bacteroidota bacterium]
MKLRYLLPAFVFPLVLGAQQPDGTPQSLTPVQRLMSQQQVLNGNDTLNRVYSNTACGLNYTQATVRLGQRFTPIGLPQPAPLTITGLPGCAVVDSAYLWFELLGPNPPAPLITLTNPQGNSITVQSQLVGTSIDVCWGMMNTQVYRANVTGIISSNGTYQLSGIPVSAVITPPNADAEGATLLIIYKDPSVSYTGTLHIDDGAATVAGGLLTHTMTGFSACATSTYADAFIMVGDLQFNDIINFGLNAVPFQFNWWNYIEDTTVQISAAQNSFTYSMNSAGDCYTFAVAGLYYQTSCQSCVAVNNPINFTSTVTPATCNNNGAITISNVTGGTGPYTYLWSSTTANTSSISNLAPGSYYLQISGSSGCGGGVFTVPYNGITASISAAPASCGSYLITPSITGGTGPFTYLWSPGNQTSPTLTVSASGTYALTVTDANGCNYTTAPVTVLVNQSVGAALYPTHAYCPSNGSITAYAYGGNAPYTYLWSTGATTSSISQLGPGTYTLTVTDQSGCTYTDTATVLYLGPLNWTNPLPSTLTVSCYSVHQFSVFTNDWNTSYLWPQSGDTSSIFNYVPSGPGVDTVVVMAMNGCDTIYDTTIVTVSTAPPPATTICGVSVIPTTNEYVIGWDNFFNNPGNTYEIYKEVPFNSGNFTLLASQSSSIISTYIDAGSDASVSPERYQVVRVDACGSSAPSSGAHVGVSLSVTPVLPQGNQLNWTAYQGAPLFTQYILRGTSVNNLTYLTSVGASATSFTDTAAGSWVYVVEVIPNTPSCVIVRLASNSPTTQTSLSIRSNVAAPSVTGVNDMQQAASLHISPNPADGLFTLSFEAAGVSRIRVYNVMGQEVYTDQLNTTGNVITPLDLRVLAPGVYMVQLDNGRTVSTARVVIKR